MNPIGSVTCPLEKKRDLGCRALDITAAREATDAQCLLPVCSEDREQVAQPFAGTSPAHPAVTLCGKVPLVVQHGVVAKIQCP